MAKQQQIDLGEGNFLKNYVNEVLDATKELVQRDKNSVYVYLTRLVATTEAVVTRVLKEVEVAEADVWGSIKSPVPAGGTTHANDLTGLKNALAELTEKVEKLAAANLFDEELEKKIEAEKKAAGK